MEEKHLAGKIAWVTGSGRGIGQAVAARLARAGADVVIHGSSLKSSSYFNEGESLAEVAEKIAKENGVRAIYIAGDMSVPDTVKGLVQEIRDKFERIDILVNNAGGDLSSKGATGPNAGKIMEGNDALFLPYEEIRTIIDRNLMTCINACKEVAPEMMKRKNGWIVNIGSVAGLFGIQLGAIYGAAKAAVHNYTRSLAGMLRPYGVYVNAVAPGGTLSPRFMASRPIDEERRRKTGSLDRYGWPEEIAGAVEFLVSERASYITGQIIRADGGKDLWPA
jgi:3-oxoacyl-[acyl-carrier protein] reductase